MIVPANGVRLARQGDDIGAVRQHIEAMLAEGRVAEALDVLFDLMARLREDNDHLRIRLMGALRKIYGRSSEKVSGEALQEALAGILDPIEAPPAPPAETTTPAPGTEAPAGDATGKPEDKTPSPETSGTKNPPAQARPHGRSTMPAHLPQRRERRSLTEQERICPICGEQIECFGTEESWYIDFEPASLVVHVTECEKGACRHCPGAGVVTATPPAKPIPGGQPGPGLLARVLVEKAEDQMPLHRQQRRFSREGFEIPETTLQGWWSTSADKLTGLVDLLRDQVLVQPVIELDGTGLPVVDRDSPKGIRLGTLWTALAFDTGVVFRYEPSKGDGLRSLLGRVCELMKPPANQPAVLFREPRFVVDGENCIAAALVAAALGVPQYCLMHGRRTFERAFKAGDLRAAVPLDMFKRLYKIEARATQACASPEHRRQIREAESWPILEELRLWALQIAPKVPPRSPLGKAIHYCAVRWMSLCLFVLDGTLPVDTGAVERQIRRIAIGRRNYLFVGNDEAARRLCAVASLCGTCRMLGIDPWRYLRHVLARLAEGVPDSRLAELLPAAWAKQQAQQAHQPDAAPSP